MYLNSSYVQFAYVSHGDCAIDAIRYNINRSREQGGLLAGAKIIAMSRDSRR